ncbi:uncharacterized protein KY384_001224 [Bacidia gigantensis]|uniref:uncharacterized protein n=1 Tax=Bacidia gigantensis TaxID=2732470 RepID=UPI001D0590DC|nr:uncharacterized protein KY384_001224 [Bacidia gigantensis]KAG8534379.1 hypothetical protein KY384_001224 [Bacidia gigantensis]
MPVLRRIRPMRKKWSSVRSLGDYACPTEAQPSSPQGRLFSTHTDHDSNSMNSLATESETCIVSSPSVERQDGPEDTSSTTVLETEVNTVAHECPQEVHLPRSSSLAPKKSSAVDTTNPRIEIIEASEQRIPNIVLFNHDQVIVTHTEIESGDEDHESDENNLLVAKAAEPEEIVDVKTEHKDSSTVCNRSELLDVPHESEISASASSEQLDQLSEKSGILGEQRENKAPDLDGESEYVEEVAIDERDTDCRIFDLQISTTSESTNHNPKPVLEIFLSSLKLDPCQLRCSAIKANGKICGAKIRQSPTNDAFAILKTMILSDDIDKQTIATGLYNAARLLTCGRHQKQANTIAANWATTICQPTSSSSSISNLQIDFVPGGGKFSLRHLTTPPKNNDPIASSPYETA